MTFNFRLGGSARRDAWASLSRLRPDILLAQECRLPPSGFSLDTALWAEAIPGRWGSGLFVKQGNVRAIEVPGFGGWIAGGELNRELWLTDRPLRVFSIHCPPGARGYVKSLHAILDVITPLGEDADLILGGDFNVAAGVRKAGDPVPFSSAERLLLQRLTDQLGFVSCWQSAHPRARLAQTLRWSRNPLTPYHCDGIFVPLRLRSRLSRCEVLRGPNWDRLSDHNPVLAEFR